LGDRPPQKRAKADHKDIMGLRPCHKTWHSLETWQKLGPQQPGRKILKRRPKSPPKAKFPLTANLR